ncbi:MAG: prephenate dehydratase [Nitrospiria bacterium]
MSRISPLDLHRKKIDEIDEHLLDLLGQRAQIAVEIGKIKRNNQAVIHDPSREKRIYTRLNKLNKSPFPSQAIKSIFREIISASHALQQPVKVAYLGPRATFSHLACLEYFGHSVKERSAASIKSVFNEVEKGVADFGVVPIENSTEGVVNHTLDLFADSPLKIFAEIFLEVTHHLLSKADRLDTIEQVYSHPQAFGQCKDFLEQYLPNVTLTGVSSTAKAAKLSQNNPVSAAIASEVAAEIYRIPILQKRIEDSTQNITRFLVISKKLNTPTGCDKTSIIVSIKDTPGALYKILRHFAKQQINLAKIGSRPSKKKAWEYLFHIDMNGHLEDEPIQLALEGLKSQMVSIKVLGSYPVAEGFEYEAVS